MKHENDYHQVKVVRIFVKIEILEFYSKRITNKVIQTSK